MINRRDFMKIAGCVVPYWGLIPVSNAQSIYSGKILVDIHAGGGLDASSWFDPREADPTLNDYARNGVPAVVAGNLRVAPMANNGAFAMANFRRMMVINGINSETNSHEDGTRTHASGMLAMAYASMPELYAYAKGSDLPLPWLNSGAYDMSAGLVPATAMPDGNSFRQLISPNAQSGATDYNKAQDVEKILATRAERLKAQKAAGNLAPRRGTAERAVHQRLGLPCAAGAGQPVPAGDLRQRGARRPRCRAGRTDDDDQPADRRLRRA